MVLWHTIKNRSLGVEFHRQVPLLDFIVDFYSPEIQLAIEIHEHAHEYYYDKDQQKGILESHGVTFLNFSDLDINQNIDAAEIALKEKINALLAMENTLKKEKSVYATDKPPVDFNTAAESKLNPETAKADFSLSKKEKLKSKKIFEELFSEGKNISSYPLKLIYVKSALISEVPIQAGVTVSKKKFKSAVARN